MRNMAFTQMGRILISYYGDRAPTDDDHAASMAAFKNLDLGAVKFLTFTEGGAPSASQRKEMYALLAGREVMTALVTDVFIMRSIVTALTWFNRNVKVFPTDQAEEAFEYLGISRTQYDFVLREVARLKSELEGFRRDHGRTHVTRAR